MTEQIDNGRVQTPVLSDPDAPTTLSREEAERVLSADRGRRLKQYSERLSALLTEMQEAGLEVQWYQEWVNGLPQGPSGPRVVARR